MAVDKIPEGLTKAESGKIVDTTRQKENIALERVSRQFKGMLDVLEKDIDNKDEAKKTYKNFNIFLSKLNADQSSFYSELKDMQRAGATQEEINASISKNVKARMKGISTIKSSIENLIYSTGSFNDEQRSFLSKQLKTASNSLLLQEETKDLQLESNNHQEVMERFQKIQSELQLSQENKIKEDFEKSVAELLEEAVLTRKRDVLRDKLEAANRKEDKKYEKSRTVKDKRAGLKTDILAGLATPLTKLTGPFFKLFSSYEDLEDLIRSKRTEKLEASNKKEDEQRGYNKEIESKKIGFYLDAQEKLYKLGKGDLATGGNRGFHESSAVRNVTPPPGVDNIPALSLSDTPMREIPPPAIKDTLADSPVASTGEPGKAQEQFITDLADAEYSPLLEKIAPKQDALLAKGGILGASAVYLGKMISGQLEDSPNKTDNEDGLIDNLFGGKGKLAKFLPTLASAAGVAAVAAIPIAMLAGGAALQKRDSKDAKKYFDKGDSARGLETAWLGDRARLTEENANSELGRATGKTALLAGGAAGVGALTLGGGAAAGMAAGGAASAAGAGLLGTGLAAAGATAAAVLPPVLIGAAIAAGVTIIAKGTQEAFELGWDKNQASIQKELNSVIFDDDASVWEKIKASAESTWKGFTGALAGGIREAGDVLDAETMLQNERQIGFLREQADKGNEDYARLLDLMQSEQFKAMNENEQKMLMHSEGLYDDYEKMRQETQKSFGEHLLTAGRTVGGFFTGLVDTTMEGMRGMETAQWEADALKGMGKMSAEDVARLKGSKEYQDTMANGGDVKSAMEAAYLKEQKDMAMARGDLDKNGMLVQKGGGIKGLLAGGAAGLAIGGVPGAIGGAVAGASFLAKYLGFGDTGAAYNKRKTGTDELDNEYRQTFEYSKRKAVLMDEGKTAEEADLAVISEQNQLYQDSLTLRLKQSADYKKTFDKVLAKTKDIKKAEEAGVKVAKENERNLMTTNQLMKAKFDEILKTVGGFVGNIGGWFKDKFSAAGQGMDGLKKAIAEGASAVWDSITEWASGLWKGIGEKFTQVLDGLNDFGSGILEAGRGAVDRVGGKASAAWDWLTGKDGMADASINDGIVLKNGKVIELSPDDNVYATKNEPRVIRDQEAQAAMPGIPKTPADFTDKNIVAMLKAILDKLDSINVQPQVVTSGGDINFDGLKMAGAL
jgi:hypothetical protein